MTEFLPWLVYSPFLLSMLIVVVLMFVAGGGE